MWQRRGFTARLRNATFHRFAASICVLAHLFHLIYAGDTAETTSRPGAFALK
jgi:hypothetical protein